MNAPITILVEIFERSTYSAPLGLDLVDNFLHIVYTLCQIINSGPYVHPLLRILLHQVLLEVRVAARVMAEDETCEVVDFVTHPQTEVSIVKPATSVLSCAFTFHDFNEVGEVDIDG